MNWISVDDALPPYGKPVFVYCKDAPFKCESLKVTVASYQSAKEIIETSEHLDEGDDVKDQFVADVCLFDDEYGGRFMDYDVTHWALIETPLGAGK